MTPPEMSRNDGNRVLECRELSVFPPDDLAAVRRAFHQATPLLLRQAWMDKPEPDFAPAIVRAGWRESALLIFAELTDTDIYTTASALNQRLWEHGDAFEIFLRPAGQPAYVEFQVAPNNQRLQLRYAGAEAVAQARKTNSIEQALLPHDAFESKTWVQPENDRWFALAKIPAISVTGIPGPLPGSEWFYSFSRYDYTRGHDAPVISSTSLHAKPDFHRQAEWGRMRFQE